MAGTLRDADCCKQIAKGDRMMVLVGNVAVWLILLMVMAFGVLAVIGMVRKTDEKRAREIEALYQEALLARSRAYSDMAVSTGKRSRWPNLSAPDHVAPVYHDVHDVQNTENRRDA